MYNFQQHILYFYEAKKPNKPKAPKAPKAEKKENALATARSKVNELHMAYVLNGERHVSPESEKEFGKNHKMLSPEEANNQMRRAEAMARSYLSSAREHHGFSGNPRDIVSVHLTGGSGGIKSVGKKENQPHLQDIESSDHPADLVVRWNHRSHIHGTDFHGISAKSNEGKGQERISNRGASSVSSQLTGLHPKKVPVDIHGHHERAMTRFHKENNLAGSLKEKKTAIRSNKKLKSKADAIGTQTQTRSRDAYVSAISDIHGHDVDAVKTHLLHHHFRVGSQQTRSLPYVIVSGHGNPKSGYGAAVHNPEHGVHSRLIINATHFTTEHSGSTGFRVHAHGKGYEDGAHVLTIQAKHNSQPMASTIKHIGTEGSLRMKTQKGREKAPSFDEILPPDKPTKEGLAYKKKMSKASKPDTKQKSKPQGKKSPKKGKKK